MLSDLWSFAVDLYARPGVEPACLSLQDAGADVCLLLCGAWLEARGVLCTAERAEQLKDCATPWQREVIEPLRSIRRAWRDGSAQDEALATLRTRVKQLELDAERQLLQRLESLCVTWEEEQGNWPWLEILAGDAAEKCRDALLELRVAAT
ncbi:TIGR02444 family protein [Pseudomonas sp. PIC25]|uniref:TIGR02444 family protein n=1 Tax=Pseudomonas sp. PIC25 TaxID=1958773 RepID=UPI000BAB4C6A|nr:TIGR02444 family protein [Pseudomonas sp. PIC25]PAU53966.1 TIGR02444 family protein [Pseudomonas sp. PIC25]